MAVYKRGYQRYSGELTSRRTRLLAFPRLAWRRLLGQRMVLVALILSSIWPLLCAAFIYIANHQEIWRSIGAGELSRLLDIGPQFFLIFASAQASLAVIAAALAGPGLVAPDLANGGLPLYLSRPLTRAEYVAARLIVLAGLLSLLTWIPGLVLFAMQTGMAGAGWALSNWHLAAGLTAGLMLWVLFVSLVALASSAWVKWRIIAGAVILAAFFVTSGAAEAINAVFRDSWGSALSPAQSLNSMLRDWFGMPRQRNGLSGMAGALALAAMTGAALAALARKLRPVEVVR